MTPGSPFDVFHTQVIRMRRIVLRRRLERAAGVFAIVALGLVMVFAVISKAGFPFVEPLLRIVFILGMASGVALLWDKYKKTSLLQAFMALDRRMDLKDLLATAFEVFQRRDKSGYAEPLLRQAIGVLASLRRSQLYPVEYRFMHGILAISASLLLGLLFLPQLLGPLFVDKQESMEASAAAEAILAYVEQEQKRLQPREEEAPSSAIEKILDQIDRDARNLKQGGLSPKKYLRSLDELYSRLEDDSRAIRQQLIDELWMGNTSRSAVLGSPDGDGPTPEQVERLKEELEDKFGNSLPQSLEQNLTQLSEKTRLVQLLSEMLDEPGGPGLEAIAENSPDAFENRGEQSSQKTEAGRETTQETDALSPVDKGADPAELSAQNQLEASQDGESGDGEGYTTAGRSPGRGRRQPPSDLADLEGPAVQDRGLEGQVESYNIDVRSLPLAGRAELPMKEIIRTYEREFEETMHKESIPESHRNFIKTYFLSIGIGRQER